MRAHSRQRALFLKSAQFFGQRVLLFLAVAAHGFIIGDLRIRRANANLRQLAFVQPQRRAAQGGEQRLIPRAVFNGLQQRRHGADFRNIKISLARVAEHGNAFRFEHLRGQRRASPRGAHENRHITVAKRPFRLGFGVIKRRADQLMNARGDNLRLPLDGGQFPLRALLVSLLHGFRAGLIENVQLDRRVVFPRRQAAEELFPLVIVGA